MQKHSGFDRQLHSGTDTMVLPSRLAGVLLGKDNAFFNHLFELLSDKFSKCKGLQHLLLLRAGNAHYK